MSTIRFTCFDAINDPECKEPREIEAHEAATAAEIAAEDWFQGDDLHPQRIIVRHSSGGQTEFDVHTRRERTFLSQAVKR